MTFLDHPMMWLQIYFHKHGGWGGGEKEKGSALWNFVFIFLRKKLEQKLF